MNASSAARPHLQLTPASEGDFEALLALRMAAMRESLTRLGHFDPQRARERLSRGYNPAHTRHILRDGELVGFVVVITSFASGLEVSALCSLAMRKKPSSSTSSR